MAEITLNMPGDVSVVVATVDDDGAIHWNENATLERVKFMFELQSKSIKWSIERQTQEHFALVAGLDRISDALKPTK